MYRSVSASRACRDRSRTSASTLCAVPLHRYLPWRIELRVPAEPGLAHPGAVLLVLQCAEVEVRGAWARAGSFVRLVVTRTWDHSAHHQVFCLFKAGFSNAARHEVSFASRCDPGRSVLPERCAYTDQGY